MSLTDLASLVSAFAVFVSLIYLALQVRQAEKNQRSIANQGVATRATDIVRWSSEPHIIALRTRVVEGETNFTATEIVELSFILRVSILAMQDAFVQHRAGLTDEITLRGITGGVRPLLARAVFRALWNRTKDFYSAEMQIFVDDLIVGTPLLGPTDIVAQFQADLARVLAQASPPVNAR